MEKYLTRKLSLNRKRPYASYNHEFLLTILLNAVARLIRKIKSPRLVHGFHGLRHFDGSQFFQHEEIHYCGKEQGNHS